MPGKLRQMLPAAAAPVAGKLGASSLKGESFWGTPGGASAIAAGADILGSAFGGDGYNRFRRSIRDQYKWATRYEPGLIAARLKGTVRGAKEAGIHPLLAMGANASGSPVMMGQPESRNRAGEVSGAISRAAIRQSDYLAQKELVLAQAELSRSRAIEGALSNDTTQAWNNSGGGRTALKPQQQADPGRNEAHGAIPEQSTTEISPWRKVRWGDQDIWVLLEDMESFTENPLKLLASSYFYHGNSHVDWMKAGRDYLYGPGKGNTSTNWWARYEKFVRDNRGSQAKTKPVRKPPSGKGMALGQSRRITETERQRRNYHKRNWRKFARRM